MSDDFWIYRILPCEGFDSGVDTRDDTVKGGLLGGLVGILGGPIGMLFTGTMGCGIFLFDTFLSLLKY